MKRAICLFVIISFAAGSVRAGLDIVRSNGITLTGADGVRYIGTSGITLTGADGFLAYEANGITLTGADGITLTGADGATTIGSDGASYTGPNGITLTGADGITLTGADGITLTGADGITLTGADGTVYQLNSVIIRQPDGITLTGADGITLTGADGITLTGADGMTRVGPNGISLTGADGITLTGADGITLTGADGITLTGADSVTGFGPNGIVLDRANPAGMSVTGSDGITLTGADGITLTGADGILMKNIEGIMPADPGDFNGLQSVDPDLAMTLNAMADDSSVNAVVVYHEAVTTSDLAQLQQIGVQGGTRFKVLPMVYVTATRSQIITISRLASVRSIYGNRTLTFNADPYFGTTGVQRVGPDNDLKFHNGGFPVSGRGVTVAVLDTGINSLHPDLSNRVVQNVRVADAQSAPATFLEPVYVENVPNSDPVSGHGTFVAGVVAASGGLSGGKYSGVAPGAKVLGLSVGDANLTHVLSGFDYILEKGATYGVRVVNCSFSANTVYDSNDPVNIATRMLTDRGVNIVFSAGNTGPGSGSMNPYAVAPWVVGVGATDENGVLARFSSRGGFGGIQQPTLAAPGVNIASLRSLPTITGVSGLGGADALRLTPGEMPFYTTASGTSFSAPAVAGAIAMMLEVNPSLTPAQVKNILASTATPLPKYFAHETGAGMLNMHAATLAAAFPDRQMGLFRSTLSRNQLSFSTAISQSFTEMITPGSVRSVYVAIPVDTVMASFGVTWGLSANDFGLRVYDTANSFAGESNALNLPGITGRREEVIVRGPSIGTYRAAIQHSLTGTAQNVYGAVELTRVDYPDLVDLPAVPQDLRPDVEHSLLNNVMLPEGKRFAPNRSVLRSELAAMLMRGGFAPQYLAGAPMFLDVTDRGTRNVVESVQSNPSGQLFYDAAPGGRFYPNALVTRLVAAVAFVRAMNLQGQAATATLPATVTDANSIPLAWRGCVAVALQRGFLRLDGNQFNPNRNATRLELALAATAMTQ